MPSLAQIGHISIPGPIITESRMDYPNWLTQGLVSEVVIRIRWEMSERWAEEKPMSQSKKTFCTYPHWVTSTDAPFTSFTYCYLKSPLL